VIPGWYDEILPPGPDEERVGGDYVPEWAAPLAPAIDLRREVVLDDTPAWSMPWVPTTWPLWVPDAPPPIEGDACLALRAA
jgi:hypothetical protein